MDIPRNFFCKYYSKQKITKFLKDSMNLNFLKNYKFFLATLNRSKNSSIFVIFDINEAAILGVYNASSSELFQIVECSMESFRNGNIIQNHFPGSFEHVGYLRENRRNMENCKLKLNFFFILETLKFKKCLDGKFDYRRQLLNHLPFNKNSSAPNISPYLDSFMFEYDERSLYFLERHRYLQDQALRLFF